jgi:predicted ATP-binding protein involved in virulence
MAYFRAEHKEIFDFLMKKHQQNPELRFMLRISDLGEALNNGRWFYGHKDEYLNVSFWNAWTKNENGELNIQFRIKNDKSCEIFLIAENSQKADILDKIANGFDGFKKTISKSGDKIIEWKFSKIIKGEDYKKNLTDFIEKDKLLIDSFIKLYDTDNRIFPNVTEERFNEGLTTVKNWQNKEKTLPNLLKKSIKLLSIRIENIKRFSSVYIPLNKRIICFYGKNGTGKTTLLRSIAIAIAGESNIDKANYEELKSLLKIVSTEKDKRIYTEKALIELTYTVDNFTEEKPSYNHIIMSYKPLNDTLTIKNDAFIKDKIPLEKNKIPQAFNLYGQEKDIFKTLVLGFAQQTKEEGNRKIKKVWSPNIGDLESLIYDNADSRFHEFVQWVADKLAPEKVTSFDQREKNRKQINEIFEIITAITEDGMMLSETSTSSTIINKSNPNGISLELMSQGYQNVVGWVGYFIKRLWEFGQTELPLKDFKQMPAICIIDEIDTYLHPQWQFRILSVLSEKFINVQFIVTSHSPFVLSSIPHDKVLLYELIEEKGEIIIKEETQNLYGAQINDVAQEMGTTKRFKTIDDKVEGLFKKIYDSDTEGAKKDLENLENEINHDDSDLRKAATLIKTKDIFNQRSK